MLLYVSCSESIISDGSERESYFFFAIVYLYLCGFYLSGWQLPLGAWDMLRYFMVALPGPSI